jgi:hypothetical protein
MELPRELRIFKHSWIYVVGLLIAVAIILAYFWFHPWTENPPLP